MGELYPYQKEAIEGIRAEWRNGHRRVLVQMATGLGKTIVFAEAARRTPGRVIILNERTDLAKQTQRRVSEWCEEEVGLEQQQNVDLTGDANGLFGSPPRICVATVQTLVDRLHFVPADYAKLLVIDEAHHAVAQTYRSIIGHFANAYVLGVTATPDRADEVALGQIFTALAYEYNIQEAVADGWLAPIEPFFVQAKVDFEKIRLKKNGDFNDDELEAAMMEADVLAGVADPIIKESSGKPFICFTASVAHAHALARVLCERSGNAMFARALDGSADVEERRTIVGAAKRGEVQGLCNCALFTEGFDWPAVELIALARPTKSRSLYTQMVGRGTRRSPETGKTRCLVLDFVDNSGRHSLITSIDLFAGDMADDVREFAYKKARDMGEMGESVDMATILDLAAAEHAAANAEVWYKMARRDPFAAVGIDLSLYRPSYVRSAATEKQKQTLTKLGIDEEDLAKLDKKGASRVITQLFARLDSGLCTPKQARLLSQKRINPENVSREQASYIIDAIAKNGWHTPEELKAELSRQGILGTVPKTTITKKAKT